MSNDIYSFQVCPKLVVISGDHNEVLLVRRTGEEDLDTIFTFIGGKLQTTDADLISGLRREKNEEIGPSELLVATSSSCYSLIFEKANGTKMFLPYFPAIYKSGRIDLNQKEYSEYRWVPIESLASFKPKAQGVLEATYAAQKYLTYEDKEFISLK